MARKGKYAEWLKEENLIILKGYARDGLTDKDICDRIGINQSTFYDWFNKFPAFSEAIKEGRATAIANVENNFYEEKLKGRTVKEKTVEKTIHRDAQGNVISSSEHVRETERYIPADTTAMIFYLKCRKPQDYNDKLNANGSGAEVEDLKPLAEMLSDDKNTDNTVAAVLEEA